MRLNVRVLTAALLLTPVLAFADPLAQRGIEPATPKGPDMTDAMVDDKKRALEKVLAKRTEEANKEANEAIALEGKLKQERIEFERKQIGERRAFLDNLKKEADQKKRIGLYAKFNSEQRSERRTFFNQQNDKRDDLNSNNRKERLMDHDDVGTSAPAVATAPAKKVAVKPLASARAKKATKTASASSTKGKK